MNDKHENNRIVANRRLRNGRRAGHHGSAAIGAILAILLLSLSNSMALPKNSLEPQPASSTQSASQLTVMSFNLHGGNSNQYSGSGCSRIPTDKELNKFKQVIEQQRASVVLAQEIHRGQADDLARGLGFPKPYFVWTKTCKAGNRALDYGNAIISRYRLADLRRYPLHTSRTRPGPDRKSDLERKEYTRLAAASITFNGRVIRLYSTHLTSSGTDADRNQQVADILRIVPQDEAIAHAGHRSILGGDFNFTPNSTPYQRLVTFGLFKDAWAVRNPAPGSGPTVPAATPRVRIDFILIENNSGFGVGQTQVVDICQGNICLSDHRPVTVHLTVK
jgi:endonuclease/exonuclease/phosphatase family metal-dependent hydrolase